MGYGILLFGYFLTFAFSLSNVYFFADIIGALIMMYAYTKLWQYNLYYKSAAVSTLVFIALCGFGALSVGLHLFEAGGAVMTAVGAVKLAVSLVMHIFIFLGCKGLAEGAESEFLVRKSDRQLVMTAVYYVVALLLIAAAPLIGNIAPYLNFALFIYWIICFIMNMILIYNCFGRLCPEDEDDEAMPRSKFGFINKINDKFDEFEENSNKYRRESMEMARAEADRLHEEKKNKYHHSKKKKKK